MAEWSESNLDYKWPWLLLPESPCTKCHTAQSPSTHCTDERLRLRAWKQVTQDLMVNGRAGIRPLCPQSHPPSPAASASPVGSEAGRSEWNALSPSWECTAVARKPECRAPASCVFPGPGPRTSGLSGSSTRTPDPSGVVCFSCSTSAPEAPCGLSISRLVRVWLAPGPATGDPSWFP